MVLLISVKSVKNGMINEEIVRETIILSRSTRLKLPDAIIGATGIVFDAKIVTRDSHLLKCQYDKLKFWSFN